MCRGMTGNLSGGRATATRSSLDGPRVRGGAGLVAFTVGTNSQLFVTEGTDQLRKTTRTNGGWVALFTLATTNPDQLFTLPDGSVMTLVNGSLEQITADTATALMEGVTELQWGSGFTVATQVNRDTALGAP